MRKVNYRSDFDAVLRLIDAAGNEAGWPDHDWSALFYTSNKEKGYRASCIGGECVNCFNDGGRIHIVFDSQHMGLGELKVDFEVSIPEEIYPDGMQDIVSPQRLGILLTDGPGDGDMAASLDIRLPYVETARPDDRIPALEERVENSESRISQLQERYVGIWDELEAVKEAIAIIQNVATDGQLRRLGYNDEDIKWFKFAIMHFDLNISQNDIEDSVKEWEAWKNDGNVSNYHKLICSVMPKYTRVNKWNANTPEKFGDKFDLRFVRFFPVLELTDASENGYASFGTNSFNIYDLYNGTFMAGAIGLSYETEWFYMPKETIGIGSLENVWPKTGGLMPGLRYIGKVKCPRMSPGAFKGCYQLKDMSGVDPSSLSAAYAGTNSALFYVDDTDITETRIGSWSFDPDSQAFDRFCKNRILSDGELHFSAHTPVIGDIYARNLKIYGYVNATGVDIDTDNTVNIFYECGGISELHPDKLYVNYPSHNLIVYLSNLKKLDQGGKWKLFWPDKSSLPIAGVYSGENATGKAPDVYIYGFHHITQTDSDYQTSSCTVDLAGLLGGFNPETDAAMLKESLASWLPLEEPDPEHPDKIIVYVNVTQEMFDVLDETGDIAPLVSKGYSIAIT